MPWLVDRKSSSFWWLYTYLPRWHYCHCRNCRRLVAVCQLSRQQQRLLSCQQSSSRLCQKRRGRCRWSGFVQWSLSWFSWLVEHTKPLFHTKWLFKVWRQSTLPVKLNAHENNGRPLDLGDRPFLQWSQVSSPFVLIFLTKMTVKQLTVLFVKGSWYA